MKAIAINGSPKPGGNTEIMLRKVLEPLEAAGWSTEYLRIGGKPVRGCMACMKCVEKRNGRCIIEGDAINDYLEKMYAAIEARSEFGNGGGADRHESSGTAAVSSRQGVGQWTQEGRIDRGNHPSGFLLRMA